MPLQPPDDFTLKDFRSVYNAYISELLSLVAEECDGGRTDALRAKVREQSEGGRRPEGSHFEMHGSMTTQEGFAPAIWSFFTIWDIIQQ